MSPRRSSCRRPTIGVATACLALAGAYGCAASTASAVGALRAAERPLPVGEVLASAPAAPVALDVDHRFRISSRSAVLVEDGLRSGYELVAFDIGEERSLQISMRSFCDCVGPRKHMMLPQLRLADPAGRALELYEEFVRWQDEDWFHNVSLVRRWHSDWVPPGRYRLLVFADNRAPGRELRVTLKESSAASWAADPPRSNREFAIRATGGLLGIDGPLADIFGIPTPEPVRIAIVAHPFGTAELLIQ